MEIIEEEKTSENTDQGPSSADEIAIIQELLPLPGKEILDRILEHENPGQLVQHLPKEDFYWLVKKVGEDDCALLLKMASEGQRQHLLDLEFWQKDRLDIEKTSAWLGRLHLADPKGLAKWFFSKGEAFAYLYLLKSIQVEIRSEEEDQDLEGRLFTLDDINYVKILDEEHKETIADILRSMAAENLEQYQSLLLNLAGVIPAELEEDLYRLRNVRLAEHGFLPPEEALEVYAPLALDKLTMESPAEVENHRGIEEVRELIPISPLYHVRGQNILTEAFSSIDDDFLLDRIRLEFAGLCNQILAAEGVLADAFDELIRVCRKAASHLNLALERLCGADVSRAQELLRNNHLVPVFRVGFGLVLELKWEAERWVKSSWFHRMGLDFMFWGGEWGEILSGIMEDRPRLHTGLKEEEEFKAIESISELDGCRKLLHRLEALDLMLDRLTKTYPLDRSLVDDTPLTLYQMLFNFWARQVLNLQPCFSGITADQMKAFFARLRAGEKVPPYRMYGFDETFIRDFMAFANHTDSEIKTSLEEALSIVWQLFSEEYAWVASGDLDGRYAKFLTA